MLLNTGLVSAAECAVGEMGVLDNTIVGARETSIGEHHRLDTLQFQPMSEQFLKVHKGERPDARHNIRSKGEPAYTALVAPGRTLPSVRTLTLTLTLTQTTLTLTQATLALTLTRTLSRRCAPWASIMHMPPSLHRGFGSVGLSQADLGGPPPVSSESLSGETAVCTAARSCELTLT